MNNTDKEVDRVLTQVQTIKNAFETSAITRAERDELLEDLLDVERIERLATTSEQKAVLKKLVVLLTKLI